MAMFSPNFTSLSGKPAEIFQGTLVGRWAHKITYQVQEKLKGQMCNDKRITDNPTNRVMINYLAESKIHFKADLTPSA